MNWTGVMPAMTTAFQPDFSVDHATVARHARWLIENGCKGIICLGSLGEAATLTFTEKVDILKTVTAALEGKAPVVSAISALSTAEAVELARAANDVGCSGLMILPPTSTRAIGVRTRHTSRQFSGPLRCLGCSTTILLPTVRIFYPIKLQNWQKSFPTWPR